MGETVAGEIQGGVLGRATLMGLDATRDLVIYACSCYYMLHDTWVQWTVSLCYQDPLTHHLFDMQLSCGMGHRMIALVRVIKYARHMHLHHILHCLQWSSTWHIFSRYWHLRLMWLAFWLSWTYHVILSCDLEFLWLYYTIVTCLGRLMFIIYMSHHACMISLFMIYHPD